MAWVTPKTDWNGSTVNGVYTGDYFTAVDFNRIKNNLEYLRDLAVTLFAVFDINELGPDRTYNDFFYADEMEQLEDNLNRINENTFNLDFGDTPQYYPNGPTMTFSDLNRLESATLLIYNRLRDMMLVRNRMFTWNFGIGAGL